MKKTAHFPAVLMFIIFVSLLPFDKTLAQSGGYITFFGGYTSGLDASWQYYDFSYDLDIQDTAVLGAKFGFAPPSINFFSFEFEYSYLNPDKEWTLLTTAGNDFTAVEGDIELHNFMFNALARYPAGRIQPYVGMGLGVSYFDFSATETSLIDGVSYSAKSSRDDFIFAWQILAGVEMGLTDDLSLDIGCRYFDTESYDDDYDYYHHHYYHYRSSTLEPKTGMITFGLKYRLKDEL